MLLHAVLLCGIALGNVVYGALPDNYESMSAAQKRDILWNNIIANKYSSDNLATTYLTSINTTVLNDSRIRDPTFLVNVFLRSSDELREDRPKLVFPFGVALKGEFVVTNSVGYTGIFNSGGLAIIRFGGNLPGQNLVATMAIKIFIDGKRSENILAEHDTKGRNGTVDYFGEEHYTAYPVIVDPNNPLIVAQGDAFTNASFLLPGYKNRPINNANLGYVEQASVESSGTPVTGQVRAPYRIHFVPSGQVTAIINTESDDFRAVLLKSIPSDTLLYTIKAQALPGCEDKQVIGQIWSRSTPVASFYEDQRLLFRQGTRPWDPSFALNPTCSNPGTTGVYDVSDITPAPSRSTAAGSSSSGNAGSSTVSSGGTSTAGSGAGGSSTAASGSGGSTMGSGTGATYNG